MSFYSAFLFLGDKTVEDIYLNDTNVYFPCVVFFFFFWLSVKIKSIQRTQLNSVLCTQCFIFQSENVAADGNHETITATSSKSNPPSLTRRIMVYFLGFRPHP